MLTVRGLELRLLLGVRSLEDRHAPLHVLAGLRELRVRPHATLMLGRDAASRHRD